MTPPQRTMKIGIMGAGAIGCYLGGRLLHAGHDVIFVGRPTVRRDLREHGLRLKDFRGAEVLIAPKKIKFSESAAALKDADVVLVTVKGLATADAARAMADHLRREAIVVSFQNGVRNPGLLRAGLAKQAVLAGVVSFNVVRQGSGFHQGNSGLLIVERARGREREVITCLVDAGLPARAARDVEAILWGKLLVNLGNSINALAGVPTRATIFDRGYRRLIATAVAEGLAAMARAGVRPILPMAAPAAVVPFIMRLPTWLFRLVAFQIAKISPTARSSMLDDLDRCRTTEVDLLNGEIVRLAQLHGTKAPVNEGIVGLVQEAENAKAGSPKLSAAAILAHIGGSVGFKEVGSSE